MDPVHKEGNAPDASSEPDSPEIEAYTVGHGKPPLQDRFKPGRSGNQRGRPRGSKNRKTIVRQIANEMHVVTENGRRRSTLELMLLALTNLSLWGNMRAFRAYEKYLTKYEPQETRSNVGYILAPADITPEEWVEREERNNKLMDHYGVRNHADLAEKIRQEKEKNKPE